MGLSNTVANVAGFIAPIVTGAITHENVEFGISFFDFMSLKIKPCFTLANSGGLGTSVPPGGRNVRELQLGLSHVRLWIGAALELSSRRSVIPRQGRNNKVLIIMI